MPKQIRKEFRVEGCTARITKRKSGKNGICYEIRYRRNGYNVAVSSTNLDTAKEKFINALHQADNLKEQNAKVPKLFSEFAKYYIENFRKEKIAKTTYRTDIIRLKKWILPSLGHKTLKEILPIDCKNILDNAKSQGYEKTAQEIYSSLSVIFKGAIAHGLIERSPLAIVQTVRHERRHGTPLTPEEEIQLLSSYYGDEQATIAIMLYCGLRPNEVRTARIDGKFIVARNSKQKNGKIDYKRIPITPMLEKYITNKSIVLDYDQQRLNRCVKAVLPNHTAKDCRMTFATRCQECGVPTDLVKIWMGHSLGSVLGNSYTKFSTEYQLEQSKKVKY